MNETENNLSVATIDKVQLNATNSQETINEIFYKEEARRFKESFLNTTGLEDDYHYLHRQLKYIHRLYSKLQLPWHEFIPVLYNSFSLYLYKSENRSQFSQNIKLTTELMKCMVLFSKSGNLLANTINFYCNQIKDIECLMKEKEEQATPQVQKTSIEV